MKLFNQREHYRPLLAIGIPIMVGQVAIVLISFIDNIMVGNHGLNELAAAAFVNNFLNLILVLGMGFSYGLTPLVAEAHKLNQPGRAGLCLKGSMMLNLLLALLLGVIAIGLSRHLEFFNLEKRLIPIALPYYYLQVISFFVSMIFNGFKQFYDGLSRTKLPMYVTILGVVLNIVLNWGLIYGHLGLPEWGLYGAGIATLVSRVAMVAVLAGHFVATKTLKRERWEFFRGRVDRSILKPLGLLGLPVAIQLGLETASFTIAVIFVARIGGLALAAHQVVNTVTVIGFLMYYGLGSATAIRVSHYRATNDYHEARNVARAAHQIGVLMGLAAMLIIWIIRHRVSYIFNSDPNLVPLVGLSLIPVVAYQLGDMLQIIYANALRGLEQVKMLVPISVLCHIIVAPALGYLFAFVLCADHPEWQLVAVWSAFPVSLTLMGILLYRNFHKECHPISSPFPEKYS